MSETVPAPSKIIQDSQQAITDPSDLRKYRTELPNLYDDLDLDVYEYRLLGHYKRVGTCTEGTATTARKCKMSTGKVSETRQSLSEKGLINLVEVAIPEGFSYSITVIDRWIENFARYSGMSEDRIKEFLSNFTPSRGEAYPSRGESTPSRGETKNKPIKNLKEEERTRPQKSKIAQTYEQEFGALTPIIADAITDAEKDFPAEWILEAMTIAVERNARNWKYVRAVLDDAKAKGMSPKLNNGSKQVRQTKPAKRADGEDPIEKALRG